MSNVPAAGVHSPHERTSRQIEELDALLKLRRSDTAQVAPPGVSRFPRGEIVAAIHRWVAEYGEPPQVVDLDPAGARRRGDEWRAARFEAGHWPTAATVKRQFGS